MKTSPTPHDLLFKKFFSDISVVTDFLEIHLPPALREQCDLSTLAVTDGSFVTSDMRNRRCDILYRLLTTSGPGYIYCLIEHQSSADEHMAFRLMRYSMDAMQLHIDQGNKQMPLVIPLLFYHGRQSPYPYSTRWLDFFADPTEAQALYSQAFPLVDLTVIPDEEIKTHRKVALLEYVQKHIRERDINVRLQDIAFLLELTQPNKEQVSCLLHYLAQEANTLDSEAFFRNLGQKTTGYKEEIMTIAEQLEQKGRSIGLREGRKEGRQEGLQEGLQEGRRDIARNMLALGLGRAMVERATRLSRTELDDLTDSVG
ncbi:Rpn family recombination-promoting nuclease/putative transposase [Acerihabitans sp. TG2]|uniref:Rpn family recombination-promoting nuclease/putative transposase n=1 Tax=Acerihabitans sp. TG2 TaxID=3096008 RepID=UPI002B22560D|nr:Rpn family recombination-promoting nuclease/putative transposase [Acerihabitans sp. TG2]MEA9390003.1 Rpn family recombination-promoting nuclease/putative transposase [Acerihabitans sp. TG2]